MTKSRTGYYQGEVVLVRFIFTDESGAKQRPAVIISSDDYHSNRQEAIIAAITSNVQRLLTGDHLIKDWQETGLLHPSVATSIIRTIKKGMIEQKLGEMPAADFQVIQESMRQVLEL